MENHIQMDDWRVLPSQEFQELGNLVHHLRPQSSPFKAAKALKQRMFPELKPTQKSCFLTPQKNFTGDRNNKNMVEDMQNISRWPKLVGLPNAMIHHCSTQIYIQDTFFQKETKQIQNRAPLLPLLDTILQVQCSLPSIAKPRNRLPNTKNDSLQHRLWHCQPIQKVLPTPPPDWQCIPKSICFLLQRHHTGKLNTLPCRTTATIPTSKRGVGTCGNNNLLKGRGSSPGNAANPSNVQIQTANQW